MFEIGKAIPDLELHIHRGNLLFSDKSLTSDLQEFEYAVRSHDYKSLLSLYHGPPVVLEVGNTEFREWQELERDRIHALFSHTLKQGIREASKETNWETVERYASAILRFDCDEEVVEELLTAIVLQNDPERAIRTTYEIRIAFKEDLSSDLSAYLANIEHDLRKAKPTRAAGFVARQRELNRLIEGWATSQKAVLLRGSGGIGKTALAHQFLRYVALRGATCIAAACDRHRRHIPFASILDLINSAPARTLGCLSSDQNELLNKIAIGGVAVPTQMAKRPVRGAADEIANVMDTILLRQGVAPRIVMFLDDAQYADASSLELLAEYFRTNDEPGALLVMACRNDDESSSKLAMRFGSCIEVVDLDRLDAASVRSYIAAFEAKNNVSLTDRDRSTVETIAGGEPFYLESLLSSVVTHGMIQELRTAGRLTELIRQRIESLTDEALSVLAVLACAERPLPLGAIIFASSLTEVSVLRAIEELVRARLVEDVSHITVAHELIGEAVNQLSTRLRRRLYHTRLADHFACADAPDHSFLAYHYEHAGRMAEAFQHLLAAAANAEVFRAVTETEALLIRAIEVASTPVLRSVARNKLARLYLRNVRFAECLDLLKYAEEPATTIQPEYRLSALLCQLQVVDDSEIDEHVLEEIITLTDEIGDGGVTVIALNEFIVHAYGRGDSTLLHAAVDRVEQLLPRFEPAERMRIWSVIGQVLPILGHGPRNEEEIDNVEIEPQDWRLKAKVMTVQARTLLLNGRPGEAASLFELVLEILEQHHASTLLVTALPNYGLALWQKGDTTAAAIAFQRGRELANRLGNMLDARLCSANLGALKYDLGEVELARKMAEDLLNENGLRLVIQLAAASNLGLCALAQNDRNAAAKAKAILDEHREQASLMCLGHHPTVFLARFAAVADGDEAAVAILDQAIERERTRDVPAVMALRLERARLIASNDREAANREVDAVERLCREQGLMEHDSRIRELKAVLRGPSAHR